jgi:hypothetical protein
MTAIEGTEPMDELLETLPLRPHAFISKDGDLLISGEHGDDLIDYYGDYRDGTPYIHAELVEWAAKHGGYWEWVHPGAICFVR